MCAAQVRDELCNEGKRILVSHRMAIKPSIVLYRS
jgi:hypothetical protein